MSNCQKKNLTDSKLQIQILALFMIIVVIGTSYKIIYLFRFFIISFYWSFPFDYFLWKHDALENENDLTKGRPSIFRRGKDISHLAGGLDLKVWRSCAEGTADDGHGSQHRDWSRQYTQPIITVGTDLQYFPPTLCRAHLWAVDYSTSKSEYCIPLTSQAVANINRYHLRQGGRHLKGAEKKKGKS
jgi:hypothetical protein